MDLRFSEGLGDLKKTLKRSYVFGDENRMFVRRIVLAVLYVLYVRLGRRIDALGMKYMSEDSY